MARLRVIERRGRRRWARRWVGGVGMLGWVLVSGGWMGGGGGVGGLASRLVSRLVRNGWNE